jgi:tetratricopeptide (TPR) repeat protein
MVAVVDYSFHMVLSAIESEDLDLAYELCAADIESSEDLERWYMLGHIQRMREDYSGALVAFQRAYEINPTWIDAVFEFGCALQDQERHAEALHLFEQVFEYASELAILRQKLAFSLKRVGRYEEAIEHYEAAIKREPECPELWSELGASYLAWDRPDAALDAFTYATRLNPDHPELWYNLGSAALCAQRYARAIEAFGQTLNMEPKHVSARLNLGIVYRQLGRLERAIPLLRRSLELDPQNKEAEWNLSVALLMAGEQREGWERYESRRELADFSMEKYEQPAWDGDFSPSETLLVHAEQGMGDCFQFLRFVLEARERVGRLVLAVHPGLTTIMTQLEVADQVISHGEPCENVDMQVPMLSLPHLLGCSERYLEERVPYIRPCPALVEKWRGELCAESGFRVGICWQGNPSYKEDHNRSIPLTHFSGLLQRSEVSVFSLQKVHGLEQLGALEPGCRVVNLGARLDKETGAFMDTAAVMLNLDLVITSDTSVAHLAGALGIPVWVALSHVPDWRWGLEGERCAWYPAMRVFRQPSPGDWGRVFEDIGEALSEVVIS